MSRLSTTIGSTLSALWNSARPVKRGHHEAGPPTKGEASYSTPTPERTAKEPGGWEQQKHPGGQVSHRAPTVIDTFGKHLTDEEKEYGRQLLRDAENATSYNLICSRTYTGMLATGSGDRIGHLSDKQRQAHERFYGVINSLHEDFRNAARQLILGERFEGDARPAEAFAGRMSDYHVSETRRAFSAGFLKALLIRIGEAYRAWGTKQRPK